MAGVRNADADRLAGASDTDRRQPSLRYRWTRDLTPLGYFIGMLALWELLVRQLNIPFYVLPPPTEILWIFVAEFSLLVGHTGITLAEALIGFVLGTLIGIIGALLMVLISSLRRVVLPTLLALQSVPTVALAPLIIVWMGFGLSSKVALAALSCFFPVFINTIGGLDRVDRAFLELAELCRANRWRMFTQIRLPNALPQIFDGMRIGVPMVIVGAIVAEFMGARGGLGFLINIAASDLRMDLVFAAIIVITMLGLSLFGILNLIGKKVMRWSREG